MTKTQRKQSLASKRQHMTRRILNTWKQATAADLAQGLAWYERARLAAIEMHPNVLISAGVIAALSPRCMWSTNKKWAQMVIDAARNGDLCPNVHTGEMRAKAWRIANLDNPTVEQIVLILNGFKITRFFRNIVGDLNAVTVDVWAQRIALGKESKTAPVGPTYLNIEAAYQAAALILGVPARDVQAATWVHIRGAAE